MSVLEGLLDAFSGLPDPHCSGRTHRRLIDIVIIAVCAVISGAETWVDIALYGYSKEKWLRTFLALDSGIPSHDTFRRVFSIIDPLLFERHFYQWVRELMKPVEREVVVIDGKSTRRSFNRANGQNPLHLVSAFATEQGLSLGQLAVRVNPMKLLLFLPY